MQLEDGLAAHDVGVRHHDLAVEPAGPQQCGVEHVGTIGRGDEDDALVRLEAVHLDQQLVESLLALIIAAAKAGAAVAADGVDFVDEDDAGRVLLGLLEHVAYAARTDADEHLDKVRARNGEERHIGFARNSARDQRLAGAGRADQKHAARNTAAKALVLARIAEELDDLLEILLGLVDAGHVLERDASVSLGQKLRARLAEAKRLAARALHLPGQKYPYADERDERQPGHQQRNEPRHIVLQRTRRDGDLLAVETLHQRRVVGRISIEAAAVRIGAVDFRPLDHNIPHLALINVIEQLRKRNILRYRPLSGVLKNREQRQQQQNDDHPEGEIAQIGIHPTTLMVQGHMSSLSVPSPLPSLAALPLGSFGIEPSVNSDFIDTTLQLPLPPNSPDHNSHVTL